MKMKRRRRSLGALVAGIVGFALVLGMALALNLLSSGRPLVAQEMQPILPTLPTTPTPVTPPRPTAAASIASTVLASPNFSGPDALGAWEIVDVGVILPEQRSVWKVEDGALLQNRTAAGGNPDTYETMAFIGSPDWTNYTIKANVYDQGNGTLGLVARRQGSSFYRLWMIAEPLSGTPKLTLEKVIDGVATPLATLEGPGYDFYTWYEVALSVQGSTIQAFVNGEPVLEATDQTLTSGQPGLFTVALGKVRFGDVVVTER